MSRVSRSVLAALFAFRVVLAALLLVAQEPAVGWVHAEPDQIRAQAHTVLIASDRSQAVRPEAGPLTSFDLTGSGPPLVQRPDAGWNTVFAAVVESRALAHPARLPPSRAPPFSLT